MASENGPGPRLVAHAAQAGDAKLVERLLGEGCDVNEADQTGCTALLYAAFQGRADVVRLLLARQYVEVNKTGQNGATALYMASQNGHVEVVRLLLARQGVEVNKTAQNGATALLVASQNGHVEVVQLLLACQGVEVNKATLAGFTALILASRNGHVEVVRLLLARQGVEVNKSDEDGYTALMVASTGGHVEVVQLLLARQDVEVNKSAADGPVAKDAGVSRRVLNAKGLITMAADTPRPSTACFGAPLPGGLERGSWKGPSAALDQAPPAEPRAVSFAAHLDGRSAPVRLSLLSHRSALFSKERQVAWRASNVVPRIAACAPQRARAEWKRGAARAARAWLRSGPGFPGLATKLLKLSAAR
jgi:ankyrin repeat protein